MYEQLAENVSKRESRLLRAVNRLLAISSVISYELHVSIKNNDQNWIQDRAYIYSQMLSIIISDLSAQKPVQQGAIHVM